MKWERVQKWWRRVKSCGIKSKPVYKTINVPRFKPQPDITAYEVALCMKQPRMWITEDDIIQWWKNLPDNIKRHYTLVKTETVVAWEY